MIVLKIFDSIINFLATEGRVELRNFGVFEVGKRKPRPARNPRTGEMVMVDERFTVKFKPGQAVRERVEMECRDGAVPLEHTTAERMSGPAHDTHHPGSSLGTSGPSLTDLFTGLSCNCLCNSAITAAWAFLSCIKLRVSPGSACRS